MNVLHPWSQSAKNRAVTQLKAFLPLREFASAGAMVPPVADISGFQVCDALSCDLLVYITVVVHVIHP